METLPPAPGDGRPLVRRRPHGIAYWLSLVLGAAGMLGLQLLAAAAARWVAQLLEG